MGRDLSTSRGSAGSNASATAYRTSGSRIAPHQPMRLLATLLVLLTSVPVAGQVVTDRSGRERVIAALERLIATGEPRHASHDDGQWLQSEVDLAFARGDVEIIRLAQRAAAPIVGRVTMPASATTSSVALTFWTRPVLTVRSEIPYRAAIWISVDGDEPIQLIAIFQQIIDRLVRAFVGDDGNFGVGRFACLGHQTASWIVKVISEPADTTMPWGNCSGPI